MASAFARRTSFGTGGAYVAPVRTATRTVAPRQTVSVAPLSRAATSIPYYDPSRVIDVSRLKFVKDISVPAEFAEQRGELVAGDDNGILGPGSTNGDIAPPQITNGIAPTGTPAMTPAANLGLLAVAAFLLFGV